MCGNNDEKDKNELLLQAQQAWYEKVMIPYIIDHTGNGKYKGDEDGKCAAKRIDTELSCPFCMGLTDEYLNSDGIKMMIVGQEPRGFGRWREKWQGENDIWNKGADEKGGWFPKGLQSWANTFLRVQLKYEAPTEAVKYLSSPFWDFFRKLKDSVDGIAMCWNDLDKVYYGNESGEKDEGEGEDKKKKVVPKGTLTYKAETFLSDRFSCDGEERSLLQREIQIADPDVVVFAVGPSYALSLDVALGITRDKERKNMKGNSLSRRSEEISKLFGCYPRADEVDCVVRNELIVKSLREILDKEDVETLWTYHPNYLSRSGLKDIAIGKIAENVRKIKNRV